MAKPITTSNATGVIKSFSKTGPEYCAIVTPDDGSKNVAFTIGFNWDRDSGKACYSVGNKVSYTIIDGPLGAISVELKKVS